MSLVSEALKKAEREAAARETRANGQPAPFEAPLQPYRSRRGGGRYRWLAPALALFGGAAALTIALLLLRPAREEEAPVKEKTAAAPEARALPAAGPTGRAGADRFASPEPEAQLSPAIAHPDEPSAASPAPARPAPAPSASEPPTAPPATPPLPRTTPKPSPPPGVSAPAKVVSNGSGDYLRSVEFADGTALELGGIVYSEASPFAYLNGRLVGVGEFVLGRRIDRIDRDKVILSGDSGEIILRLKAP